ncbi:MAG: arginase family protein [Flavonifractor plautii]
MIKYKAKNSLKSPRFAGVKTFMRMEHVVTTDDIDFAVVGIPYDTCASFRVGTRLGPAAIRDASALAAKPFNGPLNVGILTGAPVWITAIWGLCPAISRSP